MKEENEITIMRLFNFMICVLLLLPFLGLSKGKPKSACVSLVSMHAIDPEYDRSYTLTINGKLIPLEKDTFWFKIHYPFFDTIHFTSETRTSVFPKEKRERSIITRLENKHTYELKLSYEESIQINDLEHTEFYMKLVSNLVKVKKKEYEYFKEKLDSVKRVYETGKVIYILKNSPMKEIIGGTFGIVSWDFTFGAVLLNNKETIIEEPMSCNGCIDIFFLKIGKGSIRREIDVYRDDRFMKFHYDEGRVFVFDEELVSFEYLFFNAETLYVEYDFKTNKTKLKIK